MVQSKPNEINSTKQPLALWLASWYPTELDPFNGDFIQRAAQSLALYCPVHVFHLIKDEKGTITHKTKEVTLQNGLLTETIIYYKPFKTGIALLDKAISNFKYQQLGKKWIKAWMATNNHYPIIVEVAVAFKAGALGLWMKKKYKQPYFLQEHWTGYYKHLMPEWEKRPEWFWKLTQKVLEQATALLPDSRHLGALINEQFTSVPYTELPNAVDTSLFHFKKQVESQNDVFTFIHVSTIGHQKNTVGIVRCFLLLQKLQPRRKIQLILVGPGYEALFEKFGDAMSKNAQIICTGPKPYTEVATLMQQANTLVLFSRYENLPCVMLEAFCCGLPVIATRVGGIEYHLSEEQGFIISSEDEKALLQAMQKMLLRYDQFDRLQIAREAQKKYDFATTGKLHLSIYHQFFPAV